MTPDTPVLQLHDSGDSRYSLKFITDDREDWVRRISRLSKETSVEIATRQETTERGTIYLIYTRTPFETAYPDFATEDEVLKWFNEQFTESDKQVVFVVVELFDGILTEKEERNASFATYKRMELERIPEVLNHVEWKQRVPDVGAELLSYFVLAHPMPNTNHRTGIGLLDRYLTSVDETFIMPDTGEENEWYDWTEKYIRDSKTVLTLRRNLPLFRWADEYGYNGVERKEGITIRFNEIDLDRSDHHRYYANQHLERSREFVDTLLRESNATHLRKETDGGKRAFVDRLRAGK